MEISLQKVEEFGTRKFAGNRCRYIRAFRNGAKVTKTQSMVS